MAYLNAIANFFLIECSIDRAAASSYSVTFSCRCRATFSCQFGEITSLLHLLHWLPLYVPISLIIELYYWLQVSGSYSWTPQWFLHFSKAKCSGGWWGHWDCLGQHQSGEGLVVVFPFSSTSMHMLNFKISLPSHKCCLIYYLSYTLFCVIYIQQFYKWFMDLEAAMKSEVGLCLLCPVSFLA